MPHDPVDLRSDTVTRPSPGMRRAIADAVVGDDVFEDDPTVKQLEALAAEMTGKQAAVFVASGTMGNEAAVLAHTQRGDEAVVEADCHIYKYEAAGPAVMAGVQLAPLKGDRGILQADQIEQAIRPTDDVHQPITRLVCLENTHNRAGGVVYPIEVMREIRSLATERGLRIHLDGARIFNAAIASGRNATDYCALADSVMFCLSKGLGAPIGSMLVGDADFILGARRYRKMLGGGMRQAGIIAAAGIYALKNNVSRLRDDHLRARRLAEAVASIGKLAVDLATVETNIVVIDVSRTGLDVLDCVARLEHEGVLVVDFGRTRMRAVAHLDIDDADIDRAIAAFKKVFSKV
ncbi:MAG TPA: low-specificity L-threonine aldolase [bacterium]|nr:low-specificity L-threonine aldolase [bacterium]